MAISGSARSIENNTKQLTPRTLDIVRSTRGVKSAYPMLIVFSHWKLDNGDEKTVQIVGYDAEHNIGRPWKFCADSPKTSPNRVPSPWIRPRNTNSMTRISAQPWKSVQVQARVVGVTDGIRSFRATPCSSPVSGGTRSFGHLPTDAIR